MKLAIVVDTFPRWSERFIAREIAELRRRGVALSVFCLRAGHLSDENDPDWTDLLKDRVVLPSPFALRSLRMHGDNIEMQQRLNSIKTELGASFLFQMSRVKALREMLRDKFQYMHAHFANLPSTLAWLSATAKKIPFSMSVHARDLFVEPQLLNQKITDATRVFTCHARGYEHLMKIASRAEVNAGKIILMRHGLPLSRFSFTPRSALKKNEPAQLLAAGRFVPKKGFEELIATLALPIFAGKQFVLTLFGDGPLRKKLAAQIKQHKLEKKIILHLPVGETTLREIFNRADAFLAPCQQTSDGDSDGAPNVVLEAFALGLPVIGTDVGGLKEILTPETGCVVAAGKTEALANAILEFLAAPEKNLSKTLAARNLIEREYDIRKNIAPLLLQLRIKN